jgi:hypothetical protein
MVTITESGPIDLGASFRDRGDAVFRREGRIFRAVSASDAADLNEFLRAPSGGPTVDRSEFVGTRVLSDGETKSLLAN